MLGVWRFEGGLFGLFGWHGCSRGRVGVGSVLVREGEVEIREEWSVSMERFIVSYHFCKMYFMRACTLRSDAIEEPLDLACIT